MDYYEVVGFSVTNLLDIQLFFFHSAKDPVMTTYFFSVFQPLIFPFSVGFSAPDWPNRRMLSNYLSRKLII